MPAICPANSTDCLLRALVDANSGYNWNPLNFAFTAALSVLGFVVATGALLQSLLAAGPGRLKASRSAVGYAYSQKARTRFDRTELRFRTLTRVPFLDIYKVLGTEQIPASSPLRSIRIFKDRNIAGPLEEPSRSLAGWSQLLEDLNLEQLPFTTFPCATDYLPSDVQAAPAYASVESLVIMALLAGCEKIQPAEGFLRATGPYLQLEFRSHTTLGIVAVYQHYFSASEPEVDGSSHAGTIHEALGHLRYGGNTFFELNISSKQHTGSVVDYEALADAIDRQRSECSYPGCASRRSTVPSWKSFLQDEKPNQGDIDRLVTLLFADKPTSARMYPTTATDFRRLMNELGNQKYRSTWFYQSNVAQDLALLPESGVLIDIKNLERFDTLRRRELRNRDDSTWFPKIPYPSAKSEGYEIGDLLPVKSSDKMSCLRSIAVEAFKSESADTRVLREDSIVVSDQALTACFSWLADGELFTVMDSESRTAVRDNLMLQLREVDLWLRQYGGSDVLCCALNMIKDLQALSPLEDEVEKVTENDGRSDQDIDEPPARNQRPPTEPRTYDPNTDGRQTWIRCNRKWLAPETANHYDLPWEFDQRDPAYLIIKEWIPADFQAELFEHTRKLKAEEDGALETAMIDGKRNQSFFIHRRGKGRKPGVHNSAGNPSGRAAPLRRRRYQGTEQTRQADRYETKDLQDSVLRREDENVAENESTRATLRNTEQVTDNKPLRGSSTTVEDHESLAPRSLTLSKNRGPEPAQEGRSDHDAGGEREGHDKADNGAQDAVVTSYDPSGRFGPHTNDTESYVSKAPSDATASRMQAMGTMLLYRAMLFACLLATGTDTTDLLWLENRNRVVQVL